jgi:hypothetical protein
MAVWDVPRPAGTYAHPDGGLFVSQGAPTEGQAVVRWGQVPAGHVSCPHCAETVRPSFAQSQVEVRRKLPKPKRKKVPLTVLLCPLTEYVFQWCGDLADGTRVRSPGGHEFSPYGGNMPEKGRFVCPHCGNNEVITDPPYADNVHYSELADFFHVWLRLALKSRYPQFLPEYTPKI